LQLLCRRQLVMFWELQLFFFEEQVEYLLCFGYVEVEALHKPLLLDPLAWDRICPPGPLCHGHFLLFARVVRFINTKSNEQDLSHWACQNVLSTETHRQ